MFKNMTNSSIVQGCIHVVKKSVKKARKWSTSSIGYGLWKEREEYVWEYMLDFNYFDNVLFSVLDDRY